MLFLILFITFFFLILRPPPRSTLFPYTTLFRSCHDEIHAAMSVSLPPLQAFPPGLAIFIAVSAAAAAWVAQDARARFAGGPGEGWVWAIGTLVALPIFLPLYLIAARPVGSVAVCPSCGRRTIGHRAACLHCGHPITFEAFPDTWGWGEVVGIAVV